MTTRRKPDATRKGITRKLTVGRCEVYLTVNVDADGNPCELFLRVNGADIESTQGWANVTCIMASLALQYGCPMETILRHFRGQSFDPSQLGKATSIPDAIARALMPAEKEHTDTERKAGG